MGYLPSSTRRDNLANDDDVGEHNGMMGDNSRAEHVARYIIYNGTLTENERHRCIVYFSALNQLHSDARFLTQTRKRCVFDVLRSL